ncbi:MAG TPA: NAD(P)/FAD-dependent oxidoreductase [bacterium]|nr:NAD(P)/FAD-dependent oxidoreductase [bacterium]
MALKVIVIGGGASGLFAAIRAAKLGAEVTVLEKMDRPGRKLAITGKGRCNLTTGHKLEKAISEFGPNGKFLYSAFSRFFSGELIQFFEELGIPVVLEQGKRYFPMSGKASDVVDCLLEKLKEEGGVVKAGCRVLDLQHESDGGFLVMTDETLYRADRVVLATGGASYPGTGSSGDGYRLAGKLGHTIVKPSPALVPVELGGDIHKELSAMSLKNVEVDLYCGEKKIDGKFGDMMFTDFGMTGPAVLPLGKIVASGKHREGLILRLNLKPALSEEILNARLIREFEEAGKREVERIMRKLVPRRLVPVIIGLSGIDRKKRGCEITKKERLGIAAVLQRIDFEVSGTRPMSEAIVTAGGVVLGEVKPGTMESKLVGGLYICGELLDLDAGTGGFNLQAAFSTGYVAGESAAG